MGVRSLEKQLWEETELKQRQEHKLDLFLFPKIELNLEKPLKGQGLFPQLRQSGRPNQH